MGHVPALEARPSRRSSGESPVTALKVVVFPAPLGPMRLTISFRDDGEIDLVDGGQPAESDGQSG